MRCFSPSLCVAQGANSGFAWVSVDSVYPCLQGVANALHVRLRCAVLICPVDWDSHVMVLFRRKSDSHPLVHPFRNPPDPVRLESPSGSHRKMRAVCISDIHGLMRRPQSLERSRIADK